MRQEDKLKEKVGTELPYTVPEGYFESFKSRLMDNLPEYPEKPVQKRLTTWQRLKPYVYLAAMFAGIWCMMQIFHRVSTPTAPTEAIAQATVDTDSYDYFLDENSGADLQLQDEVASLYPSMDEFR
ncbi:MAG: hypothetical protein J1F07_10090, partial [Muribaculaceae bacterium]|nr:hypothetical protein [Muribaculaceae bacterium]